MGTLLGAAGGEAGAEATAGEAGGEAGGAGPALPVFPVFFDLLAVDDRDLMDLPAARRQAELARLAPARRRVRS